MIALALAFLLAHHTPFRDRSAFVCRSVQVEGGQAMTACAVVWRDRRGPHYQINPAVPA